MSRDDYRTRKAKAKALRLRTMNALLIYRRPGVTPGRFKQGIKKTAYQTRPAVPA